MEKASEYLQTNNPTFLIVNCWDKENPVFIKKVDKMLSDEFEKLYKLYGSNFYFRAFNDDFDFCFTQGVVTFVSHDKEIKNVLHFFIESDTIRYPGLRTFKPYEKVIGHIEILPNRSQYIAFSKMEQ